ncbi:hypothetical protein BCR35DRAFT_334014 [Leucosporidium creatinivorum]|uniref:Uncharacterized protein n=1 Tax=Leucosporidium creatinivorum TaxID=106004 RepID=A0A1Y2ELK3_9BASI|nr:hypothetical protein BCR35DRAFT_334014 [Leucosporidium creatinivorum]
MVAFTPLALLLSISLAVSAVPLGTARVKPTTTEAWSVVPTTSTASKTSTSTSYSATSTAVKSPNCPASKPYYIESAKSCSCLPDFAYAETCSVDSKGTIVPTTCAYGYTPGWLRLQCIPCVNGGYYVGISPPMILPAAECKGLGYTTTTARKYVTPLVPSDYTPPPTTTPTSTFSVRGRTSAV